MTDVAGTGNVQSFVDETGKNSRLATFSNKGRQILTDKSAQLKKAAEDQGVYSTMEWSLRVIVFLGNFVSAITLLVLASQESKPCMVNYTYRQDMALNVVGNPYYSSTKVWRQGPPPSIETDYAMYETQNYTQHIADIMMFPNMVKSEFQNAGFLPVRPLVNLMAGAGEYLAHEYTSDGYYFYWDPQLLGIRPRNLMPEDVEATNDVMLQLSGSPRPGMQVPNLYRCARKLVGTEANQIKEGVRMLTKNSQLRGACLLSGQQHTVDISSNMRTSMNLFSSINPMFMVALVCWICASFALFELGHGTNLYWLSEVCFSVSTLWNIVLMLIVILPGVRDSWHIPLNNALIAEGFLGLTILVQWRIATLMADDEVKESSSRNAVEKAVEEGQITNPPDDLSKPETMDVRMPGGPRNVLVCTASSFLSAASAKFEDVELARERITGGGGGGGGATAYLSAADSKYSSGKAGMGRRAMPFRVPKPPMGSGMEHMPYHHYMLKTGDMFVVRNYLQEIRKESNLDCVQHIEFVLTIPLLFTVVTGSAVSFIPTGVLQQIFVLMAVSHMLCTPIIFVARRTYELDMTNATNKFRANHLAIALLFMAFFMMQMAAIVAKWEYMKFTVDHYQPTLAFFQSGASLMTVLQSVLIFMVTIIALPSMLVFFYAMFVDANEAPQSIIDPLERIGHLVLKFGWVIYFVLGFAFRIAIIWVIYKAASDKEFSLWSCDVWRGKHALI